MNSVRSIRVQRLAHAHKDLRNAVADNLGYFIFVDGVNKGAVAKNQYIDIPIRTRAMRSPCAPASAAPPF